tara:strand:+ start:241 stop:492 length:252 start_codon:yes stop_codon:yes gene_type:complete
MKNKPPYFTLDDLTPDQLKNVKIKGDQSLNEVIKEVNKKPKQYNFSKEEVRKYAIKVLNTISQLSYSERMRVLDHARKMNDVN